MATGTFHSIRGILPTSTQVSLVPSPLECKRALPTLVTVDDLFVDGWFKPFCLWNLYVTPTFLSLVEMFFLNSIKRQVVCLLDV